MAGLAAIIASLCAIGTCVSGSPWIRKGGDGEVARDVQL
jgi:hypothetical protein